ncbi:4a-hydroxytetrahydrobiopterin dehydratase [Maribellus mangrovi]|uniref:4a-hydroxytetrahydrobiopterin dehydratase n=1 Tax=Maribellus mangrovi TaxID=3133146 RepID=UPI0030ECA941
MIDLKEKHCKPCEEGTTPIQADEIGKFKEEVSDDWKVVDNKKITKEFPFENFKRGMAFAQNVALIAETENHHPDMCIHYSSVNVELSTHKIGGLSANDFILAAKIDEL